jgi:aspartate/methionine/tyrosine aminotransferase
MSPPSSEQELNPAALELNARLEQAAPEVLAMLSPLGRRLYFPSGGILAQSAEAKVKAHTANATIGIATEGDGPMVLPSVASHTDIDAADAFNYAPPAGRAGLRERWREKLLAENPSLRGKQVGLPVVTSAITHGLMLAGDLFVEAGDRILLPDKMWGNYRLLYEVRLGAKIVTYPFYSGDGFDTESFAQAVAEQATQRDKLVVLLNFPNNPTGYAPTPQEGEAIAGTLLRQAEAGTRIVALLDDAYFGLFYHLGKPSMTESLFAVLAGRHANLLAVKLDGATKELFVWGLRCGFFTVGPGRAETAETVCEVLDAKLRGAIRSGISNVPMLSQSLVEKALEASSIDDERKAKREILRARAEKVHAVANEPRFSESWQVYPFNSGYFMCIKVKDVPAAKVRSHLLDEYGIGVIATSPTDLRVAFSCLELAQIQPLFETLHKAIRLSMEMRSLGPWMPRVSPIRCQRGTKP